MPTVEDLNRNERTLLRELFGSDELVPAAVVERILLETNLWKKVNWPGGLPREQILRIIAPHFRWDSQKKQAVPLVTEPMCAEKAAALLEKAHEKAHEKALPEHIPPPKKRTKSSVVESTLEEAAA